MIRVVGLAALPRGAKPLARRLQPLSWGLVWPTLAWARTEVADNSVAAFPWVVLVSGAGLALVCVVVGAILAFRASRSRQALAEALHDSRTRAACLEALLDGWSWRSDRSHRLIGLQPPPGAAATTWSAAASAAIARGESAGGLHVWECFASADAGALRALLDGAAPFDAVTVRPVAAPDDEAALGETGSLSGRVCTDARGAFAGYQGTYRSERKPRSRPVRAGGSRQPLAVLKLPAEPGAGAADRESFAYTVSHDLRAPLRVVEGFTKIIKEDYGRLLDRVGNDHLDRVMSAAARMNNMIDALLALSKLSSEPLARQPVDLSQLAGYVVDDLIRQWPDRSVAMEIEPGMQVLGDPTLLRLVIENLLGNAFKYTSKVEHAEIGFVRAPNAPDTFTVRDNGAGFDMRFADRLFSVFQRLHSANDFPGTGVGLASVRRIVRRHGGQIWSEAEVNRGARFHFSLPGSAVGDPTRSPWEL